MRHHWHQHSYGYLPDGTRVMLCIVASDSKPYRSFPVVLNCRPDGLYRLWRNKRSQMLVTGFAWPDATGKETEDAEKTLQPHVPKFWGIQHMSSCVLRTIPQRVLSAKTADLPRLLIAWYLTCWRVSYLPHPRSHKPLRPKSDLPVSPLWRPFSLTTIPNTDVVVRAIRRGVLLQRLKIGLERIYISEMAWIRAPSIETALFDVYFLLILFARGEKTKKKAFGGGFLLKFMKFT